MMKKAIKRVLALVLSAVMVIGLVACGNNNSTTTTEADKKTDAPTQGSTTEGTEAPTDAPTEKEVYTVTYPLDTDVKVTLWTSRLTVNGDYNDYTESPFHTGLIKNTGVDIVFRLPMTGQKAGDAYNLLFTEDKLPDAIQFTNTLSECAQLYYDGLIRDLTPYIEQYAPDYWAWINSDEQLYKDTTTTDGKIICFFPIRESHEGTVSTGPMIRKDWLDEQNLESPVTLADWENVLTVFKEKYGATLGFQASSLKQVLFASGTNCFYTGSNGGTGVFYRDDNGEIQVTCMTPEWKEYMEVLNRWYENGLINPDSMTMDTKSVRTKAANNQIGASYGAMSQLTNFNADAEANGNGAVWVGTVNVRAEADKGPFNIQGGGSLKVDSTVVITKDCPEENLITLIQMLNYGYTEEGMLYYNFGTEGVTYTKDADGNIQWTDLVKNDPQGSNAYNKYTGASAAPIGIQMNAFGRLKNHPLVSDAVQLWIKDMDTALAHKFTKADITEEESLIYTDRMSNIDSYINEMVQKFIMGKESLDNIDAFYKQLEQLGINEVLAVVRAQVDRYDNR